MKGNIVKIQEQKLYGFIRVGRDEYFFHRDDFVGHWDDLIADYNNETALEVEFVADTTPKGLRARNVRRTDWPNQSTVETVVG